MGHYGALPKNSQNQQQSKKTDEKSKKKKTQKKETEKQTFFSVFLQFAHSMFVVFVPLPFI